MFRALAASKPSVFCLPLLAMALHQPLLADQTKCSSADCGPGRCLIGKDILDVIESRRGLLADAVMHRHAQRGLGGSGPDRILEWPLAGRFGIDILSCSYMDHIGTGIEDFMCGMFTYNGHTGTDMSHGYRLPTIDNSNFLNAPPTAVFAALDGTIIRAEDSCPDNTGLCDNDYVFPWNYCGNHVLIDHGDDLYTLYCHFMQGSLLVNVGAQVRAGTQLGSVGNTGNSTGHHTHFEPIDGTLPPAVPGLPGAPIDPWVGACNSTGPSITFYDQPDIRPCIRHDTTIIRSNTNGTHKYYFGDDERTVWVRASITNFAPGHVMQIVWSQNGAVFGTQNVNAPTSPSCQFSANYSRMRPTGIGTGRVEIFLDGNLAASIPFEALAGPNPGGWTDAATAPPSLFFKDTPTVGRVTWGEISPSVLKEPGEVTYTYTWLLSNFIVLREWTTDALSDALWRDAAQCGQKITFRATAFNQHGAAAPKQIHAYIKSDVDGDNNCDGVVGFGDITNILSNWGGGDNRIPYVSGDSNGDGLITFPDVTYVLARWPGGQNP